MSSSIGFSNLLTLQKAKQKQINNQQKLLTFLYQEKYSTAAIVQQIINLKTRSGTCKVLRKMERDNLIKKYNHSESLVLWGITQHGLHEALTGNEERIDWNYFEPAKVNIATLDHQLDIQKIHAVCMGKKLDFRTGRLLGSRAHNDKIPDGIIEIGDKRIAVEVERHVKSKRRYDAVIYNYLKAIKAGSYHHILYVAPDEKKREQVKNAIYNIGKITMNVSGKKKILTVQPEKHFVYFDFISIEDTSTYIDDLKNSILD
jgi:hypothetical protein